jgi:protein ImuB
MPMRRRLFLKQLAEWCDIYTPLVGLDPPDGLLFDITGVAHLFGGEPLLPALSPSASPDSVCGRASHCRHGGRAWAAARYGKTAIVVPGQTAEAMTPLPLGALRLETEIRDGPAQLGFESGGRSHDAPACAFGGPFRPRA